jgi:hypothetical protein
MVVFLVIAAFILGIFFGAGIAWSNQECPREIRGYNCKGETCNHSRVMVMQAKADMYRGDDTNYWKGDDR